MESNTHPLQDGTPTPVAEIIAEALPEPGGES
jgi:hypothetical protein